MSRYSEKKLSPSRYHHGDLRAALLAAARSLAAESGVEGLTLREVARRAGVSHAAPYHHFPDKAALLRALATDAFVALGAALESAASPPASPQVALTNVGVAYVRFALSHPVEFRFMFRRDLCPSGGADGLDAFARASAASYQVLQESIAACQRAGLNPLADPRTLALTAWSTVHGLAELLLNDPTASLGPSRESPDDLVRAVVQTMLQGLLATATPAAPARPGSPLSKRPRRPRSADL